MRHRLVCPLYDQHPKHLEVLNHLDNFAKTDRGRELATLAVAGYAALYGRGETAPKSLDYDFGDVLLQLIGKSNLPAQAKEAVAQAQEARPVAEAQPENRPQRKATAPRKEPESVDVHPESDNKSEERAPVSEDKHEPESHPTPPVNPTPPPKPGLEDEAPSPEEDEEDEHIDALSLIGSQFG